MTKWEYLTTDIALLKSDIDRARRQRNNALVASLEKKVAKMQAEADAIPEAERHPSEAQPEGVRYGKPLSAYAKG